MKKMIAMYVSLVACLMFAGTATAAEVVYTFAVDGDVIRGTITIDVGNPASSGEGVDTYLWGNGVTAFSLTRNGSAATFDGSDDVWDFIVELATADNTPISFMIDCDDSGGDYIFADPGFDFGTGAGQYEPGDVTVTGAALTPAAVDPSTPTGILMIVK